MKVLVATDKPFAKVAVDGIRKEIEAAGYELVLLEKYGDAIYDVGLNFMVEHMCFSIEKAARDLEYKPFYTPEDAVIESARWAAKVTNCKF